MSKEPEDSIEHIVVYTGDAWEAVIIRYLLNKDGIKTWLINEKSESIEQTRELPSAWDSVTIKVSNLDYDRAKLIVANYEKKAQDDKFNFET